MDKETIASYDNQAHEIAQIHSNIEPSRLYELIRKYFVKDGLTADVGCGIGRDTYWMIQQGFPSIGIDASQKMLDEASFLYPSVNFVQDSLPELNQINSTIFQNILCSAILMHINKEHLKRACIRLIQLLDNKGCLIISFRSTIQLDNREKGRLYELIDLDQFTAIFTKNNCKILVKETEVEASRQLEWHNFIIRKN